MVPSKNNWFYAMLAFAIMVIVGLLIGIVIVCSLIPTYLQNSAAARSQSTATVYTLRNVTFITSSTSTKNIRSVRDTLSTPILSATMIQSFQDQLNILLNTIDAKCVIANSSLVSINYVVMTINIYFNHECIACYKSRVTSIQKALTTGTSVTVNAQYYTDCSLNAVNGGQRVMTLQIDGSVFSTISRPSLVTTASLVQQPDLCQSQTKCEQITIQALNFAINPDYSQDYTYYCFYWTPPNSLSGSTVNVQFALQSGSDRYVYLDDVTFNSTSNFIQNGGFEAGDDPSWNCASTCSNNIVQANPHSGTYSFDTSSGNGNLAQFVTIPMDDNTITYHFGFWLKFSCDTSSTCAITATVGQVGEIKAIS